MFEKTNSTLNHSFRPTVGVPQGSVIGLIQFCLTRHSFASNKSPVSQFADNSAHCYRLRSPKLIQKHLQPTLNSLIDGCNALKNKTNQTKTLYLIFKKPLKKETSLEINIKEMHFQKAKLIKFLGIVFIPHLKWNEYCKDLVRRANARLFLLWKLSNLNINEGSLILVYKSWIRPLSLYSIACWLDHSHALINKIQNVQNRAVRICLRKPRWHHIQNSTKRQT